MTEHVPAMADWRVTVDHFYSYLIALFFIGVLAQVFLAGVGVFGDHASKVANASSLGPHRDLGTVLGFVAVLSFVVALVARIDRSTVLGALALGILTMAAQPILASGGDNNKWVGGLHALDGMLILLLSLWLTAAAHRREAARRRAASST